MIKVEGRFDEYAYRVATYDVDSSVTALEEGQWVTLNSSGKVIISDGTANRSFLCISSKRSGRDQITGVPVKKASFLVGQFLLQVSNYYADGSYSAMTPLCVTTDGVLTPYTALTQGGGSDIDGTPPQKIVAFALGAPVSGYLPIVSV